MATSIEDFDHLYAKKADYYSEPSDGLIECVERYSVAPCPALDVGCGQGRNAIWLAQQGFSVLALDKSAPAISLLQAKAQELALPLTARLVDVTTYHPGSNSFGLIVIQTTLNHMQSAAIPRLCDRLSRALLPGGLIYCVAFTTADPGFLGDRKSASECATLVKYYFPPGTLKEQFSKLSILSYEEYTKEDRSHGPPHVHGKAKLIAKKAASG